MRRILLFLFVFPQICSAQVNLTQGLVAYYPFSGNNNDLSGNNNNPVFNNATLTIDRLANPNSAYHFNGIDNYMKVPNSPSLNMTNQMSIALWVKPMGYYTGQCYNNMLVMKGDNDYMPGNYFLRFSDAYTGCTNPTTAQEMFYGQGEVATTPIVQLNQWYSVVWTSDGITAKMYVNCVLRGTGDATQYTYSNAYDLFFGHLNNITFPYWLNGDLDEVRIYNRPLNQDEVNALGECTVACPVLEDFNYTIDPCNPFSITFQSSATVYNSISWDMGDGTPLITGTSSPSHTYANAGNYTVTMNVQESTCADTVKKTISLNILPADIIITKDTTICAGSTKQLLTQPALSFCWSPTTYLDDPNSPNPVTSAPQNITYYFTAEVTGNNLITNGDFSAGNTGFTSEYIYANPNITDAQYFVGTNPQAWNPGAANCVDHTTGNGNMMLLNGAATAGAKVWTETVTVLPNTNYAFSCWVQSIYFASPALLQFSINNNLIGPVFTPGSTSCNWQQFYATWNSGNNTSAIISIVDQNTAVGGNDFALDDISFAPVFIKRDSVVIKVDNPVIKTNNDTTICAGRFVQLNTTGPSVAYTWSPAAGLSNTGIANPIATPAITTQYIVAGTNVNGCVAKDTVLINVNAIGTCSVVCPAAEDFDYTIDPCNPLSVTFQSSAAVYNSINWDMGDGTIITGNSNPSHTYASPGNYIITMDVVKNACTDTIKKTISLNILLADIILTPDTTICFGSVKQLRTQPSLNFCWSPATYLSDPNSPIPVTSTPQNITYYFTAEMTGNNLIINGDFSQGNTGFASEYIYANPNIADAQYFVGTDPQAWNAGAANCVDHTTGNGNMLLLNGAATVGTKAWTETVTVIPNTNYAFSCWTQSIYFTSPAMLQFSINNNLIGPVFTPGATSCNWQQFYATWNSGNNTIITISIVDQNTTVGGNDFALDDISFAPVFIKRDSVVIKVDNPVVKTNNDTTVCAGRPVQLNTTGPAVTYKWSPAAGLSNSGIANPLAIPTTSTQYIITGTTVNGCIAKDSVVINVNALPVITKTNDTTICHNTTIQLNAAGGNAYSWLPAATLSNPLIPNPVAAPVANTIYYITVTGPNTCSNTDSVKVAVKPVPVFTISADTSVCYGIPVQLNAGGGNSYTWLPAASLNNPSVANPVAAAGTTTLYQVKIVDSICNDASQLTTTVTVLPLPDVIAQKSNDIDCGTLASQLTGSGARNYLWTPSTGLNNPAIANPVARINTGTTYILKGTDLNGCIAYDTIDIKVTASGFNLFNVPNAFTPNGDGNNDCFGISKWGAVDLLEFSVYNRFGEKIFTTKNPGACWDGTYKGKKQDPGGFAYIIRAKTFCGDIFRKGIVMLVR